MRPDNDNRLKDAVAEAQRRHEEIDRAARTLARLEITATSPRREVSVTVDSTGMLKKIVINADAMPNQDAWERMTEDAVRELTRLLTDAGRAAQMEAAKEVRRRQAALGAPYAGHTKPSAPNGARRR